MASIFISYTNRDGEGFRWAQWMAAWLREWGYQDLFLDKDPDSGIPAAADWRRDLISKLRRCRAVIALCTPEYQASPWCMAELGIALDRGKLLIPLQLGEPAVVPLLLQDRQAIQLDPQALDPAASRDARESLKTTLDRAISWRDKLRWEAFDQGRAGQRPFHRSPFPGLSAYDASHAPLFFGRDQQISELSDRVRRKCSAGSGLLLLLGSSGCGKSSLLGAGLVPLLRQGEQSGEPWLLLEPFRPLRDPLNQLNNSLSAAGIEPFPSSAAQQRLAPEAPQQGLPSAQQLLERLEQVRRRRPEATLLLVIDQFEELLTHQADAFLELLAALLRLEDNRVLLLASLRTDVLARLEQHPSGLTRLRDEQSDQVLLAPIASEGFEELITAPLEQLGRGIEPRLKTELLGACASGGGDLLPLLSYTLQQLWERQEQRWVEAKEQPEPWRELRLDDYRALGGLAGSVRQAANDHWRPEGCAEEERLAVREAFLRHLLRLSDDDRPARRPARRRELPERSLPALDRLVRARLLVSGSEAARGQGGGSSAGAPAGSSGGAGGEPTLEIAHEALLRTWPTLEEWIKEGQEELLQRRRVRRLADELAAAGAERSALRTNALEQLAALAAQPLASGERLAVRQEASEALQNLLTAGTAELADRQDAALLLALIDCEEPLLEVLRDAAAPVALRRRAAESLGLLARRRSSDGGDGGDGDRAAAAAMERRRTIERELEAVLRGEPLDVRIAPVVDPEAITAARQSAQQTVAAQVAEARASGQLARLAEAPMLQMIQQAEEQETKRQLWAKGRAPGWAEHDARLPLLQGAARGLQLAASAELPLVGSGAGHPVPMLTLTALEEGEGLRIRTEVVEVPVWRLPLPELPGLPPQQLELVAIAGDTYPIGSPREEAGRDVYTQFRQKCEGVNVEAERRVRLGPYWMARHPISQTQWRAVLEALNEEERGGLNPRPGISRPEDLWERHGQPGALPVESVSWNACRQWLDVLNGWLKRQWTGLGGQGEAPRLALPSESQWEVACRAGAATPFHFGSTLDASWANVDANYTYGLGRQGPYRQRLVPNGCFGLVNRWGLAELHGQLAEWCEDRWHPSPVPQWRQDRRGWFGRSARKRSDPLDGQAWEEKDPSLAAVP
ncbi:MAG: TIR domain-containing protein, partial [Synechococcaceae cyanobacterium]|nr:TIR domain-containing protein [Synechococcaceae cyanobacterium]